MLSKFLTKSKRKIALLLLFLFVFSALFSKPIQAFSTKGEYFLNFENAVFQTEEMNLQSFVYETLRATVGSIRTLIIGCLSCPPEERSFGMIGTMSTLIATLYSHPPASGINYLADMGKRLEFVKPSYAQEGTGFEKMEPYREIWQAFRNLAYVFFVLILVFMGFAIMFRVKISPQAVITIQSALPKIVFALILITFSYAIVGFLVDIMFVAANLVFFTMARAAGFYEIIERIHAGPFTSDIAAFGLILMAGLIPSVLIMLFFTILPTVVGSIFAPFTLGFSLYSAVGTDFFIIIILAIIFLIALIRVFWSLLRAYVIVVLNLIFAPFQILIGVLPGSNAISTWFRNLLANLAVFPATLMMVLISFYLVFHAFRDIFELPWQFITGEIDFTKFLNDFTSWLTTGANIGGITVLAFISLGVLLLTPRVSDMIKSFLAGKPFEYGAAIGEAVAPAPVRLGARAALPAGAMRLGISATATPNSPERKMYEWGRMIGLWR